jgi:hypothetical protein
MVIRLYARQEQQVKRFVNNRIIKKPKEEFNATMLVNQLVADAFKKRNSENQEKFNFNKDLFA